MRASFNVCDPAMKLFYSHASPYARTCRVMLREKNALAHVTEIEVNALDNPPELVAHNPLGKIPCLLLDNHQALFDSTVINDYLNETHGGADLLAAHKANWQVKTWASASQGLLDVAVQWRIEKTKPSAQQHEPWMARNHAAIVRTVAYFDAQLPHFPRDLSFLHLHLFCALAYVDFRHGELNWAHHAPALADWYQTLSSRPSLRDTTPK